MAYLKSVSIAGDTSEVKEYTAGDGIRITSDGVVSAERTAANTYTKDEVDSRIPNVAPAAITGSYNDLTDKPYIPPEYDDTALTNRVSQLESGKQNKLIQGDNVTITGDIISAKDTTYTAGTGISIDGANQISAERNSTNTYTKDEVNSLIPTNVSAFTNDANYQSHTQVMNLIQNELADFDHVDYEIVDALPATGKAGVRYLVKTGDTRYEEWIYLNGQFYDIGPAIDAGSLVIPVDPVPEPTANGAIWITT